MDHRIPVIFTIWLVFFLSCRDGLVKHFGYSSRAVGPHNLQLGSFQYEYSNFFFFQSIQGHPDSYTIHVYFGIN